MSLAYAAAAILIWSSLATLSVALNGVPALFLMGSTSLLGGLLSLPWSRRWNLNPAVIAIGAGGQFFYHLLYFVALRTAPPVNASLVHYTWPMFIVLLSPWVIKETRLRPVHIACALVGFAGAALAMADHTTFGGFGWSLGYACSLAAALVWASYSLALKRLGDTTPADVGLSCIIAGVAALLLHGLFEPTLRLSSRQVIDLAILSVGPMGIAFYLWAYALKHGDPRSVGVLSNATPLLSTAMLIATGKGKATALLVVSACLVCAAGALAVYSNARERRQGLHGRVAS